jgi:hypothetical protein
MKFISHILLFLVGAALGIWWGVYHPVDVARIANAEQQTEQNLVNTAKGLAQPAPPANAPPPAAGYH